MESLLPKQIGKNKVCKVDVSVTVTNRDILIKALESYNKLKIKSQHE